MATKTVWWLPVMLLASALSHAHDDCDDPVGQWQSQDTLRRSLEAQHWTIRRIKIDDGCYEAYGVDRMGNHFEAKFSPATLVLRSLEIEFKNGGNLADYLDRPAGAESQGILRERAGHQPHAHANRHSSEPQE